MLRNAICFRMVLEYQKCETKKSIKHDALNSKNVNMQINEFKMLTLQKEAERIQNGDSLNKERIRNTILNDKANELQH